MQCRGWNLKVWVRKGNRNTVTEKWVAYPCTPESSKTCWHVFVKLWLIMGRHRGYGPRLVGWLMEFNVPFQHKYGYIRDERSGVGSYPLTQWRKASDILTSTLAAFLFSSHPNRERDRKAHLNYYASAYNRGRQLSARVIFVKEIFTDIS